MKIQRPMRNLSPDYRLSGKNAPTEFLALAHLIGSKVIWLCTTQSYFADTSKNMKAREGDGTIVNARGRERKAHK